MNATSESAAEGRRERDVPAFWDEVSRLMDEQGIESLEDLYGRFIATCAGRLNPIVDEETWESPRPEAGPMSFAEFCEAVVGDRGDLGPTFIVGLAEVFDLDTKPGLRRPGWTASIELCESLIQGCRWNGVEPKTPLPECAR